MRSSVLGMPHIAECSGIFPFRDRLWMIDNQNQPTWARKENDLSVWSLGLHGMDRELGVDDLFLKSALSTGNGRRAVPCWALRYEDRPTSRHTMLRSYCWRGNYLLFAGAYPGILTLAPQSVACSASVERSTRPKYRRTLFTLSVFRPLRVSLQGTKCTREEILSSKT